MSKSNKTEVTGPRANGKGKGLNVKPDYFPKEGTLARQEIMRVVESGAVGVLTRSYLISDIFLGQAVGAGLLSVAEDEHGESRLYSSKRTLDILSDKIKVNQGSELKKALKLVADAKTPKEIKDAIAMVTELKNEDIAS